MMDRKCEIALALRDLLRPLVNTMLAVRPNFREILESDLDAIGDLLMRGFGLASMQEVSSMAFNQHLAANGLVRSRLPRGCTIIGDSMTPAVMQKCLPVERPV